MKDAVVQMIKDWTIRRKILTGFGIVLVFNAALAWIALSHLEALRGFASAQSAAGIVLDQARVAIAVAMGGSVVVGVVIALFLSRLIADPLTQLGILAEQVAKGDLSVDIRSRSRDEIGWLEHSMRTMVKSIREIVAQITAASRSVAASADEISASSAQMAKGAEAQSSSTEETSATMVEMASQMQLLAKSAEALAAGVDETSASIQQMSATLQQTAQHGEALQQAVERAVDTLTAMMDRITAVASRVHMVDEVSQRSVAEARAGGTQLQQAIASIGSRSGEIGTIVETIDWIADQVNLLALNAAIEAARAGDAGRGFAVVAEEVRRLAERSLQATKEIGEVIKGMQAETQTAVTLMEEVLAGIVESVDKTSQLVSEAAKVTEEQAAGTREVLAAAASMADLAREIALAAKENAAGAQEITAAAEKMNQLTHRISEGVAEQKRGGEQIVKAVEGIALISRQHLVAVEQMRGAAKGLAGESEALKQRVEAFTI